MGAKIYLANIPFARSDNQILQTSNNDNIFNTSYTGDMVEVDNLRILQNGTISFIIDLSLNSIYALDYDTYNSVVVPTRDKDGVETGDNLYYKIRAIAYTSATNYLVTADPLYYNAIKDTTALIGPKNIKSKSSFIKRGYAYDSIVKNSKLNLSSKGDTDIYMRGDFPEATLPLYHQKIQLNHLTENTTFPSGDVGLTNQVLNSYILGWCIYYLALGTKEKHNDTELNNATICTDGFNLSTSNDYFLVNALSQPYAVCVAPIVNMKQLEEDSKVIKLVWTDGGSPETTYTLYNNFEAVTFLDNIIVNGSANVIYSKVVKNCPILDENFYSITSTSALGVTTYTIKLKGVYEDIVPLVDDSNTSYALLNLMKMNGRTRYSMPISRNTLTTYGYPKGFDNSNLTLVKADIATKENPYLVANMTRLQVSNKTGGAFNYTPLQIGRFENLIFGMVESLTPDVTKEYCYIDKTKSSLADTLLRDISKQQLTGLVDEVDNSYPYSKDQLNTFLASNKNFYQQWKTGLITRVIGRYGGMADSIANMRTGLSLRDKKGFIGSAYQSEASMTKITLANNLDIYSSLKEYQYYTDNLLNAPDELMNVNGNVFYSIQLGLFGFFIDLFGVNDLSKKIAYQDFIQRGMLLNRFIETSEVSKYVSLTSNAFDKAQIKYCEGVFDFYYDKTLLKSSSKIDYKLLNNLKEIYANGVHIYNVDNITHTLYSNSSQYENEILYNVDQEDLV